MARGESTRTGRPSELTPETRSAILAAVRLGVSRAAQASAGRIDESTLYRWLRKGKKARSGDYREFYLAFKQADAEGEVRLAGTITSCATGAPPRVVDGTAVVNGQLVETKVLIDGTAPDWRAAAWMLERRKPKTYGKREKITHAGDPNAPVVFELDTGGTPTQRGKPTAPTAPAEPAEDDG